MIPGSASVLLHGAWQRALAHVTEVDALITDPPFGARTHAGQTHRRRGKTSTKLVSAKGLGYPPMTPELARAFVASWSPRTRGWFCVFTSHDLIPTYEAALERAGRCVFAPVVCVQRGQNVRLAGDGPANWSTYLVVARPRTLGKWRALPGAYTGTRGRSDRDKERKGRKARVPSIDDVGERVPGQKPLWLMREILRDYSRPGDLVCDPFAGRGTTAAAALYEGRRFVGAESVRKHFDLAVRVIERVRHLVPDAKAAA